jgi:hypothetical protein
MPQINERVLPVLGLIRASSPILAPGTLVMVPPLRWGGSRPLRRGLLRASRGWGPRAAVDCDPDHSGTAPPLRPMALISRGLML